MTQEEPAAAVPRSVLSHVWHWTLRAVPYLFVPALAWYVYDQRAELERALDTSWPDLFAIAALVVLGQVLNASEFGVMYRGTGLRIGFLENQGLFNAGQLGNYLPMQVGTLYRLRYLKTVHRLRYANTASVVAMNIAISLASTAVVGAMGVVWVTVADGRISWIMVLVFAAMLSLSIASARVALPSFLAHRSGRLPAAWREFHAGWETVRRRPRVAATVLVIDVVKLLFLAMRFSIAFRLLGVHLPFGVYLVVGPVAAIVSAVSFTPGSIGFREAAVVASVRAMGYSIPGGLLAATIDRAVMLVVSLVLGGIGYVITLRRLRQVRGEAPAPSVNAPG
jgi:uncharacterized membrane protein YbhN (UPF0104 family)